MRSKKLPVLALAVALILSLVPLLLFSSLPLVSAFSGSGSGTVGDPYIITTVTQLQEMKDGLTAHYALGNNIDASDTATWNEGAGFEPIGTLGDNFAGTFDGRGYKISDLYMERANYVGLFGCVGNGGVVENVELNATLVYCENWVGALVGKNFGAVSNSYSTGFVDGNYYVGGLVGRNYGTVSNCYSTSTVEGSGNDVGALVGWNDGTVSNSYSTGSVDGNDSVGGLVGYNPIGATVSNSYSTSSTSGSSYVGGLVGWNHDGTVSNCYSIGTVSGIDVGGLVGYNSGTVGNSFWDNQTSGQATSDGGTGKTTENMKNVRTYTDTAWSEGLTSPWDFVGNPYDDVGDDDNWDIDGLNNNGYPFLSWQTPDPPDNLKVESEISPQRVTTLTPSFSFSYTDNNAHRMKTFQMQVGTSAGDNSLWDNLTTQENENGDTVSVTYAGSSLSRGVVYWWRVKTQNTTDIWSGWSDNENFRINKVSLIYNIDAGSTVDENCVLYLNFDENTGQIENRVYDSSGENNHGDMHFGFENENTGWAAGYRGSALIFDGVDDYVNCDNAASLNFGSGDFTIEAWIKTTQSVPQAVVFSKYDNTEENGYYYLYIGSEKPRFEINDSSFSASTESLGISVINDNLWHHIVGVRDGNFLKIFIDGNLENTVDASSVGDINNYDNLVIGQMDSNSYFEGSVDEVRLYNRALTADEINRHYLKNWLRLSDTTPKISWSYYDNDEDICENVQIQVGTTAGGNDTWDHQENLSAMSIDYAGSTLTRGTIYYVRARVYDYQWSEWSENRSFKLKLLPEIASITVDNVLIDRDVDFDNRADNDVKITIRVKDNEDNADDISAVYIWIRDNQDLAVVDNVGVTENTLVDENTLDFVYWYVADNLTDASLGLFDVKVRVVDTEGDENIADYTGAGFELFTVDDHSITFVPARTIYVEGEVATFEPTVTSVATGLAIENAYLKLELISELDEVLRTIAGYTNSSGTLVSYSALVELDVGYYDVRISTFKGQIDELKVFENSFKIIAAKLVNIVGITPSDSSISGLLRSRSIDPESVILKISVFNTAGVEILTLISDPLAIENVAPQLNNWTISYGTTLAEGTYSYKIDVWKADLSTLHDTAFAEVRLAVAPSQQAVGDWLATDTIETKEGQFDVVLYRESIVTNPETVDKSNFLFRELIPAPQGSTVMVKVSGLPSTILTVDQYGTITKYFNVPASTTVRIEMEVTITDAVKIEALGETEVVAAVPGTMVEYEYKITNLTSTTLRELELIFPVSGVISVVDEDGVPIVKFWEAGSTAVEIAILEPFGEMILTLSAEQTPSLPDALWALINWTVFGIPIIIPLLILGVVLTAVTWGKTGPVSKVILLLAPLGVFVGLLVLGWI